MAIREFDGFEDGDYAADPQWTEPTSNGTATIQSTTVRNGSNALQISGGQHTLNHDRGANDSVSDGDTYQVWLRAEDGETVRYGLSNSLGDITGNDAIYVELDHDNDDARFAIHDSSGNQVRKATLVNSIHQNLPDSDWFLFEIIPLPSSDEVEFRVFEEDGTEITSNTQPDYSGVITQQHAIIEADGSNDGGVYVDDASYSEDEAITTISGTVTAEGSAADGVKITAINDADSVVEATTTTDSNGNYSVDVSYTDTHHVLAEYDDGSTQYNGFTEPYVGSGVSAATVDFSLDSYTAPGQNSADFTLTAPLETTGATATATGGTTSLLNTGLELTGATAEATGGTTSIDAVSTLETTGATVTATGGTTNIDAVSTLETTGATATATGGTSALTPVLLIGEGATATATGGETSFNVPGTLGEITVLIDGQRIDTYTDIEAKKRLNEVDTFSFQAFITDSTDRQLIQEGNEVKIIEGYNSLLFKGVLNEVEYKSSFRAECEGNGMVQKLLNRKTNRDTYTNSAGDDIVKAEVPETVIDYGQIDTAPQVSVRFDHDNLARAVAGVANAVGYDWYIGSDRSDGYDTDQLFFVDEAGSSTIQQTFEIGNDAQMVDRNKDEGFVANNITLLGRGDGINQLEAQVFAASNKYTDTTQVIDEDETGSFELADSTALGQDGDNIIARVGTEVFDLDVQHGTSVSETEIGSTGSGQQDFSTVLEMNTGGIISTVGFEPNGGDSVDVTIKDSGENILAEKTDVTPVASEWNTVEFVISDYSRELEPGENITLEISVTGLTSPIIIAQDGQTVSNSAFDVNNDWFVSKSNSGGGTAIQVDKDDRAYVNSRGLDDYNGDETEQIKHYEGVRVWTLENKTQGTGRFTPESRDTAEDGSSIEVRGVKELRDTDKTIVDLSTLEKTADLELKNRFEDVFRVQVEPTDPRVTQDLELGDTVEVRDLTAMDVDDEFRIVGMDVKRASSEEGTVLHLANRPRRLTERLSEIESNTDTLNAHMQGATNFNGEHFEDNADNTHPLNNKVFIPDDVVKVNKFELTFARESFRGYVQNSSHSHEVTVNIPDHDHEVLIEIPDHDHEIGGVWDNVLLTLTDFNNNSSINYITTIEDGEGGEHSHTWPGSFPREFGAEIGFESTETTQDGGGFFLSETTDDGGSTTLSETTENSGTPEYGIFEPDNEPDIDVEVRVDGNTVTTINDVAVGDEISTPIDLKPFLSDPLTGEYHDIELVPIDTGGGNDGRSRLVADVTEKVFIESTL